MLVPGGGDLLADPQEHDFQPAGIAHCDAVDFRVAMPLVRYLLPGQDSLGAAQFGGVPRTAEDARHPGFADIVPGGVADLPESWQTSFRPSARPSVGHARSRNADHPDLSFRSAILTPDRLRGHQCLGAGGGVLSCPWLP